ncbi:MAG: V-type ATP synthase subunit K [Candidatus Thermoplasmatota archaeon]
MITTGLVMAIVGGALGAGLTAIGSSIGVGTVGLASAKETSEDPEKFGKMLILQVLPGTQGIYGFLAMFWVMLKVGLLVMPIELSFSQGLAIFFACLPIIICGSHSAIWQAKVAISSVHLLAKRPEEFGKAIILPIMIETYAVLSLLATILLVNGIPI